MDLSLQNRRRLDEIRSQSGWLDFGQGKKWIDFEEMVTVGEIGHGTCGHVSKMKLGDRIMAVKVGFGLLSEGCRTVLANGPHAGHGGAEEDHYGP